MLEFVYDEPNEAAVDAAPVPQASVRVHETTDTYGVFTVEPLPRGMELHSGIQFGVYYLALLKA